MPDPITVTALAAGALSGAAGNLVSDGAKRVVPALWNRLSGTVHEAMQRALPQARAAYEANAAYFVGALAEEVARDDTIEQLTATLERQLEDPDVATAVADALRAAGRTSSADRHRTLARVVTARLGAPPDSGHAVAANLAVRAADALGAVHLRTLATLALVHYVARPNPLSGTFPTFPPYPPRPAPTSLEYDPVAAQEQATAGHAWFAELTVLAAPYVDGLFARFRRAAERLDSAEVPAESVAVHLTAAGCVIRHDSDPDVALALCRIVGPPAPRTATAAARAPFDAVRSGYRARVQSAARQSSDAVGRLASAWKSTLHHLALTPAGFLIGLAAFDVLAEEQTSAGVGVGRRGGPGARALVVRSSPGVRPGLGPRPQVPGPHRERCREAFARARAMTAFVVGLTIPSARGRGRSGAAASGRRYRGTLVLRYRPRGRTGRQYDHHMRAPRLHIRRQPAPRGVGRPPSAERPLPLRTTTRRCAEVGPWVRDRAGRPRRPALPAEGLGVRPRLTPAIFHVGLPEHRRAAACRTRGLLRERGRMLRAHGGKDARSQLVRLPCDCFSRVE